MSRITTGFFLYFAGMTLGPTALANAAKYDIGWVKMDGSEILTAPLTWEPPQDWTGVRTRVAAIKAAAVAAGREILIGTYVDAGGGYARPWDPIYPETSDAEAFHKPDGTTLVYNNGTHNYRFPNTRDEGFRERAITFYLAFLAENGLDGVFFDSWAPAVYSGLISSLWFTLPGGLLEGPFHLTATWIDLLKTWTTELATALEAGGFGLGVWGNGLQAPSRDVTPDFTGAFRAGTLDSCTGALFEYAFDCYRNTAFWTEVADGWPLTWGRGQSLFLVFPWLFTLIYPNGGGGSTVPYATDPNLERFYLATYLLVAGEGSSYGYSPYIAYFGFDGGSAVVHWSPDWDHDYGVPTGAAMVRTSPETLAWRRYTTGYVVVNPTSGTYRFGEPGTYRLWHPTDGLKVDIRHDDTSTHLIVPPYTGYFLWDWRAN